MKALAFSRATARWFAFLTLLAVPQTPALAALVIGPTGLSLQTFDTPPPASSWSTLSIPGAASDIETHAALDAAVQTVSATNITAQLVTDQANPPGNGSTARWSSSGLYLQTRPTGNAFTLLMATLQNGTG